MLRNFKKNRFAFGKQPTGSQNGCFFFNANIDIPISPQKVPIQPEKLPYQAFDPVALPGFSHVLAGGDPQTCHILDSGCKNSRNIWISCGFALFLESKKIPMF